jgi:hypothetical protein
MHATTTSPEYRKRGWVLSSEAARLIERAPQTIYRWYEHGHIVERMFAGYRRYVWWNSLIKHIGPVEASARGLKKIRGLPDTPPDGEGDAPNKVHPSTGKKTAKKAPKKKKKGKAAKKAAKKPAKKGKASKKTG